MSAILDTIIARGFNLNQPEFGRNMIEAQNRRQVIDSGLQNDEIYRRNSDFQMQQLIEQQAQQQRAAQSLSALAGLEAEMPEVQAAQERALANSNNLQNIRPELQAQAAEMLMKPVNERAAKAQALKAEYLRNSPAAQDVVGAQMFAQPELEEQGPLSELGKLAHDMDILRQQNPNDPRLEYFDKKMAAAGLTGGADGGMPADVQTALWYSSATPEQRANFDRTKRAQSPFAVYMDGGRESVVDFERASSAASTEGTESGKARMALSNSIPVMIDAVSALERTLKIVEEGAATGRLNQYLASNDAELQFLQGVFNDSMLAKLAEAKASGATPGAMSEGEWKIFGDAIANIRNKKEANVELLKYYITKAKGQLSNAQGAYEKWELGGANPRATQPAPTPAPAPTDDADIDPIVERNLR